MLLPAAVSRTIVDGNYTSIDTHAMELLELLSTWLGFRAELVASKDNSTYGLLTGQADGTGISGLLARREAALTTMLLTMIDNRLKAVSYVPVQTFAEPFFIFYRWSRASEKMDLIYIYILKLELMYALLGAVLSTAIVGAIVHVVTRSCSMQFTEPLSVLDIRRLSSFPSHICFRYPQAYASHSGGVLLASWAVFLVVLGAALSAFLVTNFVILEAPPVKSLQQLNSNKDFRFGINGASDMTRFLLTTSTDPVVRAFSARLTQLNRSDPDTTSSSPELHFKKVVSGGYAYVGSTCVPLGMCEKHIPENITGLVYFKMEDRKLYGECFVAVSKDAFFQRDLYVFLLQVEQLGILEFLRKKYLTSKLVNAAGISLKHAVYQTNSENTRVGLLRVLLVVYVALAGIGLAVGCLLVELVVYRWLARNTMRT